MTAQIATPPNQSMELTASRAALALSEEAKEGSVLESRQNVLDLVAQTGQKSTMPREARVEFATR
jgi:hypothetical protein